MITLYPPPFPSECHLNLVFCLTLCSSYIVSGYFMLGAGMNIFMGTSKHTAVIWNKAETRRAVCYYLQGTSCPAQGWLSRNSQGSRTVTEWSQALLSHPPWLTFVAGICGTKHLWNTSCFQTAEQTWTNSSGWGLVSHGLCWLKLVLSGAALTNRYRGQLRERLHRAGKDEAALSHLLYWENRNLSLIFNKSVFSRAEVIPKCSYCFPLALLVSYLRFTYSETPHFGLPMP